MSVGPVGSSAFVPQNTTTAQPDTAAPAAGTGFSTTSSFDTAAPANSSSSNSSSSSSSSGQSNYDKTQKSLNQMSLDAVWNRIKAEIEKLKGKMYKPDSGA